MQNVSVSRRYARALLSAAGDQADEVLSQLESLDAFLDEHPEVMAVLANPALPRTKRLAVLEGLFKGATFKPVVINLLKLLNDRNRLDVTPMLVRSFRDMVDAKVGRVRGRVTSAAKLGEAQLASIRATLEGLLKKTVLLEATQDKALLGGVVAQVGSHTYDGSLRTQLRELGQRLERPTR